MAEAEKRYEKIHQNLIDAGCDQKTTDLCMVFVKEGQLSDMMPILRNHRNALLESVHKGQKQIDGLEHAYIVKDDIEYGYGNVIPLWMFGLNY